MTKLGRPPLADAKTVIGQVRLTKGEAAALTKRFGSVPRGLRAIVNASLATTPGPVSVSSDDPTPVIEPPTVTLVDHRHRRGVELESRWQGGTKVRRYECAEDGCETVLS